MDEKNGAAAVAVAARQRFTVELRPGETTIVSWKKLLKDAARATSSPSPAVAAAAGPPPSKDVNPMIESRLGPVNGQPAENELKDGHPSRFGAVIEKIERLYMGKHSSDEEDLNDVPDDDEYDTEDSFIDDAELDDYFQVDNSAIKHDGFFVNRGKLERINLPASSPGQQQKKRRRKDLDKNIGDDGELPNKLVKVAQKPKKSRNVGLPHVVALPSVHNEEMRFSNQTNTSAICTKKKSAETKTSFDPSVSSSFSKIEAALSIMGNVDRRVPEMLTSKNQGNKSKDGTVTPNAAVMKPRDKIISGQRKSAPVNLTKGNGVLHVSAQWREKDDNHEKPDRNVSAGKSPMSNTKALVVARKEGSSVKPKGTILEKTIGELAKMVAESRPPSAEVQDADMTSQAAGKKRLPREVKQKLAKVARLAQANYGRIPDELVNRLMGILGHLIQMRTLKRNLKDMVTMGLTAKKEKDVQVQEMKKDVAELIKMRVPYIKSKVLEQQAGGSDDFQEMGNEEKEFIKRKYGMDHMIEDKICDLYDLYVDSLDEEAGTQARKLYAELATLWPDGFMDNHGIKRAICRSKDRKRALHGRSKDQEKIKSKKLVPKSEGTVKINTSVAQPQHTQEKSVEKQDNSIGKIPAEALAKKKMKRKPETELVGGQARLVQPVSASGAEKGKSHKQVGGPLQKPSLPSVAAHSATTKAVPPHVNLNNSADMA